MPGTRVRGGAAPDSAAALGGAGQAVRSCNAACGVATDSAPSQHGVRGVLRYWSHVSMLEADTGQQDMARGIMARHGAKRPPCCNVRSRCSPLQRAACQAWRPNGAAVATCRRLGCCDACRAARQCRPAAVLRVPLAYSESPWAGLQQSTLQIGPAGRLARRRRSVVRCGLRSVGTSPA